MDVQFKNQVALLLRILPEIAKDNDFALHGGTAINLFYHNMPRLSVDIDLTYIPFGGRPDDLAQIKNKLRALSIRLVRAIPFIQVKEPEEIGDDLKLHCSLRGAQVKVEVNMINRGVNGVPVIETLCKKAQDVFNSYCQVQVVPAGQLFGGKIVAALDRQHPRDLFDVQKMFENAGYTEEIHKGFLFCLLSSKRPVHEILQPNFINQKTVLESQFSGMTDEAFTYELFELARIRLLETVHSRLLTEDKLFLKSFAEGNPQWPGKDLSAYPGIKWKLININKLKETDRKKYILQFKLLENALNMRQ